MVSAEQLLLLLLRRWDAGCCCEGGGAKSKLDGWCFTGNMVGWIVTQKVDGQLVLHQNKVCRWTSCVGCLPFPLKVVDPSNHQHMHCPMLIVVVKLVGVGDRRQAECQFLLLSDVKWFHRSVQSLRVVVSCMAEGCGGDGIGDVLTSRLKSAAEPTPPSPLVVCLKKKWKCTFQATKDWFLPVAVDPTAVNLKLFTTTSFDKKIMNYL